MVSGSMAFGLAVLPALASPVTVPSEFSELCTPTDPALAELSGLVAIDDGFYAIGDSGADGAVAQLGPDCAVTRWIQVPVDPYDIEDLAWTSGSGSDRLWLADVGDNQRRRDTVALIGVSVDGSGGSLHRLTYPDGPHDAETILLGPDDVPVIVTKTFGDSSGIYRPAGGLNVHELAEPGPTPLEKVGEIDLSKLPTVAEDETGRAAETITREIFTGGAVSHDGTVAAVRSYSHVHLFDLREHSVAQALTEPPFATITLPQQPQGEAVTFTAQGDLVIASEAREGPMPPLLVLPGAVEVLHNARSDVPEDGEPTDGPSAVLVAVGLAAGFALLGGGMLLVRGIRRN